MRAINLKTEYLINPLGIDIVSPRLMWTCEGDKFQSAYQVILHSEGKIIFDSGKVLSSDMFIDLPIKLSSRQNIDWTVTLWNEKDKEGPLSNATFEMGLLSKSDWIAKWITGNYNPKKKKRYPVDYFLKKFNAQNIKKARLYISSCGLYEAKINDTRVGEFVLAPGSTDYRKRI